MPKGDGNGPQGLGPRSGGRRGRCLGAGGPEYGAGRGKGGGFGLFWENLCYPFRGVLGAEVPEEATLLKLKIADAEGTLAAMKDRLGSLSRDER